MARRSILSTVHHQIVLESEARFGARVPPRAIGAFLGQVDLHLRHAVSMAFRGTSRAPGRPPGWLVAAWDARFVELEGRDEKTVLHFESPTFGAAAPRFYEQRELWPTRPDPQLTGFEVFTDALREIRASNAESDRYDPAWLRSFRGFSRVLDGAFRSACIQDVRPDHEAFVPLDLSTITTARRLGAEAPTARRVRVVGRLDMIRLSTQSFALQLDRGEDVRGVLVAGGLEDQASELLGKRIAVDGTAVFRPSGSFLRLDAEALAPAEEADVFFSRIPKPLSSERRGWSRPQTPTTGVNAFFGRWPGEETEEELLDQLDALRLG